MKSLMRNTQKDWDTFGSPVPAWTDLGAVFLGVFFSFMKMGVSVGFSHERE